MFDRCQQCFVIDDRCMDAKNLRKKNKKGFFTTFFGTEELILWGLSKQKGSYEVMGTVPVEGCW